MNEDIAVTLPIEDWMSVTGALVFLERFDGQGKLKNLSDRINSRIINQMKEDFKK